MELRHYITFFVATLMLQIFIWIFNRTLHWLFASYFTFAKRRKWMWIISYVAANSFILLTLFRLYPMPRTIATMLVLLLFISFVSAFCLSTFYLLKSFIFTEKLHRTLRLFYPFLLGGLVGLGLYNAYVPRNIYYQIQLDKPIQPMRIAVVSDLHLGSLFGNAQLDKLAQIIEQEKVDLVLMPGDIMDDNLDAYMAQNMRPHFAKIKAPLGVYATLGNHDFFGQQQAIKKEIELAGIRVLFDESTTINNQFVLIGRNDDLHKQRPSAAQLLQNVDVKLPIILLDHRPTEIEAHAQLPIDIQVSGHAHKGQIFPANIITTLLYRLDYGYEKIGNGHFFVTSGYGFWGVPIRLGTQSEVMIIDVK